jgi:hypothetical protein
MVLAFLKEPGPALFKTDEDRRTVEMEAETTDVFQRCIA